MTTLGNENLCNDAETTKKRAHAIKSRLGEMGHKAPLSHAYEILATSCGYRNWPTMKAARAKVEEVSSSTQRNVVQPPMFRGSSNTKMIGPTIFSPEELPWTHQDRLEKGSANDITSWIVGKISDEGSWGAEWKGRVVGLLFGIMRALVYLRDQKGRDLNLKTVRGHLPLDRYVKFAWGIIHSDVPDQVLRPISSYLNATGYVDGSGRDQSDAVVEVHGYLEAIISDALGMIETDLKWHAFKVKRHSVG